MSTPKILFLDVETAPLLGYVWQLWDQNVGLNQIHTDWNLLSWAAKWEGDTSVMYQDLRAFPKKDNDKPILSRLWELLDEADIIVTQNGKKFDEKKINARFIMQGFKPPSPFRHVDTLQLAKKRFGFTSNKLEYMSDKLCTKYKKLAHKMFPGFELWRECLANNQAAWREMEKYNKHDVLALEELYTKLAPWGTGVSLETYGDGPKQTCTCGGTSFVRRGFQYTKVGKYQQLRCQGCGAWSRESENLLIPEKRKTIRRGA